jgi:hypothetical protein
MGLVQKILGDSLIVTELRISAAGVDLPQNKHGIGVASCSPFSSIHCFPGFSANQNRSKFHFFFQTKQKKCIYISVLVDSNPNRLLYFGQVFSLC